MTVITYKSMLNVFFRVFKPARLLTISINTKAIQRAALHMLLQFIDQFNVLLIIAYFVYALLTWMLVRNRCIESQVHRGNQSIKVLYHFVCNIFIFLHFFPFYYWRILSFSDPMYMDTTMVLPFKLIPPVLQIPLPF